MKPIARHWWFTIHESRRPQYLDHLQPYFDACKAYNSSNSEIDWQEWYVKRQVHHVHKHYIMHYSAFCNIGLTLEAIEEWVRVMSDMALPALPDEEEESALSESC
jgi:hypothetical protein